MTRKIARSAARIKQGLQHELLLGNLDAKRDWGFAPNYVEAFWRMLQGSEAGDLVLATGQLHTVRDWLDVAFEAVGLDWKGYVKQDPRFLRKADPSRLVGDPTLAREKIGWAPTVTFENMVRTMVSAELPNDSLLKPLVEKVPS